MVRCRAINKPQDPTQKERLDFYASPALSCKGRGERAAAGRRRQQAVLDRLHQHRACVNEKLLVAASAPSVDQLRREFQIGQGSIWTSLYTLYAAEFVWLEALLRNDGALVQGETARDDADLAGKEGSEPVVNLRRLRVSTLHALDCLTQSLEFLPAFSANCKVLRHGLQSFWDWLADEMEFSEFPDVNQARVAVDLIRLRGAHNVEHFLDFFGSERHATTLQLAERRGEFLGGESSLCKTSF